MEQEKICIGCSLKKSLGIIIAKKDLALTTTIKQEK